MSDEVIQAYQELKDTTAMVMVIRNEEMPAILAAAKSGDEDARMRLAAVGNVVPVIEAGGRNCVLCDREVSLPTLAAMIFVSKKIEPGASALWTLVCHDCDEADQLALCPKVMAKMGFSRVLHEAGHA